jgi:hypothetical protein
MAAEKTAPACKAGAEVTTSKEDREQCTSDVHSAQVVPLRRWCASCGAPTRPRQPFCWTCYRWRRVRSLSIELNELVQTLS